MFASSGNEIKIWDSERCQLISEFSCNKSKIDCFSIKSDNTQIASVIDSSYVNLIQLDTNNQFNLPDSIGPKCCSFDSAGRYLAVGNTNGLLDTFDFKSQSLKKKSWKLDASISALCWSKNDRYIATGNTHGSIILFNTNLNSCIRPLQKPQTLGTTNSIASQVTCLQYSPKSASYLGSAYDDGSVIVWDVNKEAPYCTFRAHSSPCLSLALSSGNMMLMISGGLDKTIAMYDVTAKKSINSIQSAYGISSLDLLQNDSKICIGTVNGYVLIYDFRSKVDEPLYSFQAHIDSPVHCIKYFQTNGSSNSLPDELKSLSHKNQQHVTNSSNSNNMEYKSMQQSVNNASNLSNSNTSVIKKSNSLTFESGQCPTTQPQIQTSQNQTNINGLPFDLYSPENVNNIKPPAYKLSSHLSATNLRINNSETNNSTTTGEANTSNSNSIRKPHSYTNGTSNNILTPNNNISNRGSPILLLNNVPIVASSSSNQNEFGVDKSEKTLRVNKNRGDFYSPLSSTQNPLSNLKANSAKLSNDDEPMDIHMASPFAVSSSLSTIKNQSEMRTPKQQLYNNSKQNNAHSPPVISNNEMLNQECNSPVQPSANQISNEQTTTALTTALSTHFQTTTNLLPLDLIREMIRDSVDELREEFMSENFRFKAELIKEFMSLRKLIVDTMHSVSLNDTLVEEINRLKEENKRLKKLF